MALLHPDDPPRAGRPSVGRGPPVGLLGEDVHVGALVVVGPRARSGRGSVLHPLVTLGEDTELGDDCVLHSGVQVRERCRLGQPGDRAERGGDRRRRLRLRQGRARAATTRSPSAASWWSRTTWRSAPSPRSTAPPSRETRIGRGVKLDNLVQIGHSVTIGEDTVLAGQVGIAGSTRWDAASRWPARSGWPGISTIGDGVIATAQTGIPALGRAGQGGFRHPRPSTTGRWLEVERALRQASRAAKAGARARARDRRAEEGAVGMAVLVTGGAGYIGSAFVELLRTTGESVVVLDDLSRGHRAARRSRVPLYVGTTGDRALVARIAREHARRRLRPLRGLRLRRGVGHRARAATSTTTRCRPSPSSRACSTPGSGAWSSPRPARPTACRARARSPRPTRSGPSTPTAGRSSSWSGCSRASTAPAASRFVALRYFNAAGATAKQRRAPRPRDPPHSRSSSRPRPAQRPHVSVFGDDYETPDGTAIRDYIHVDGPGRGAPPRPAATCARAAPRSSSTSATARATRCSRWSTRRDA